MLGALAYVVGGWKVLGVIIRPILHPWCPIEPKLALCFLVPQPVEVEVHGLQLQQYNGAVDNAVGRRFVSLDRRLPLRPADFTKGLAEFGLRRQGEYMFRD